MADKKFLDEDGVSQFAEETKKYVDKHADNADIHVTTDDKANWDGKQDALTAEQLAAVNSGINATDKGNYDAHIANADIHVTSDDKANWNAKANDADVVHKSGNETIAGVKTFTSSTVIDGSGKFYQAYASDYIKGVVPSAATYQGIRFYDDQKISTVANHITGAFELQYGTDGYNKAYVGCRNYSGTSQLNYNVGLRVPNDSTRSIDFHPSADNKINLGTSSYRWADTNTVLINGKTPAYASDLDDLVHKSGNETVNGTKTFTLGPVSSNGATTNGFFIKNTAIARNDVPTNIYHSTFRVNDKNDKILGEYCVEKSNSGSSLLNMNVRTDDSDGNQVAESLYLNLANDGGTVNFHPGRNNRISLGTSSLKWKDVNTVLLNGKDPAYADDLSNYLPLSGGQMTGSDIKRDVDDSFLRIRAGVDSSSAYLFLVGKNRAGDGGNFALVSANGNSTYELLGKPNGTLTWGGKPIDTIEEQGDGYIRYSSGIQICCGMVNLNNLNTGEMFKDTYFAFPKSFISAPAVGNALNATGSGWADFTLAVQSSTTQILIEQYTNRGIATTTSVDNTVTYIAIGRWK